MVEQVDRDAATKFRKGTIERLMAGEAGGWADTPDDYLVQAFRDHRSEAEARGMAEIERLREALQKIVDVRVDRDDNIWAGSAKCRVIARAALNGGQHE